MRQAFFFITNLWLDITRKTFSHLYIVKEKPCLKKLSLKALSWITHHCPKPYPLEEAISNFDIRLVQPNEDSIPAEPAYHRAPAGYVDQAHWWYDYFFRHFGCRTGFHMIMWGQRQPRLLGSLNPVWKKSLSQPTDVPGTKAIESAEITVFSQPRIFCLFSAKVSDDVWTPCGLKKFSKSRTFFFVT